MARLLAVEWDSREARVAVGRTRGRELTVEHAFAVPLATRDEEPTGAGSAALAIQAAVRRMGLGRVETLVAVGRANTELRQLSLPPVPADELPDVVRFQALRQFTTIGEDWPLDFVELTGTETEGVNVLAAAISPDTVRQITATCGAAGLLPKRIVLRPFAAASLLRRHDQNSSQPCRLMVDLSIEEADLSVLDGGHLLLTRTVRLSSAEDREIQARGLLGEIRRTIAAGNNQLGGRRIEKVVLCGDGAEYAAIRALVEQELALAIELFDPFTEMRLDASLQAQRPEKAGRFAPLLGLLADEAQATPPAIDFLHPRRKIERVDTRRRNILIAATIATAGLAALLLVWMQLTSLDDEIAQQRSQSARMKADLAAAEKTRKEADTVQQFLDHHFNWLDELALLAEQLPSPDDVLLTQVTLSTHQPNGGQVRLEGFTREPTQFQHVEERLRAAGRTVTNIPKPDDLKREKYRFGFAEVVRVPPRSEGSAAKSAAPSPAAPSPAASSPAAPSPAAPSPTAPPAAAPVASTAPPTAPPTATTPATPTSSMTKAGTNPTPAKGATP